MREKKATGTSPQARLAGVMAQYGCGPIRFLGTDNALYERHLLFDQVRSLRAASARDRFEALARAVRDVRNLRTVALTIASWHEIIKQAT